MDHPIASGRDADVYALGAGRILRRYRRGGDTAREAAIMTYVDSHGFPVPRVYSARGTDLVLERLDGVTMHEALRTGDLDLPGAADILADLHARLHALPPRPGTAGGTVVHLDLHPDNVMLTSRGPVLIDWRNATNGPPDLDLAMTALILAQVAVGGDPDLAAPAGVLLTAFLVRAGGDPGAQLARAVEQRRRDPALTASELDQLDQAAALVHRSLTNR